MPRDTTGKAPNKPLHQHYREELLPGDIPKSPGLIALEGYGPIRSQPQLAAAFMRRLKARNTAHPYKFTYTPDQDNLRLARSERDANTMSARYPVKNLRAVESGRNKVPASTNLNTQDMQVAPHTAPADKNTEARQGELEHPHPSMSASPHGKKHIFLSNGPIALDRNTTTRSNATAEGGKKGVPFTTL